MGELYKRIDSLCKSRGITISEMCRASGASRGSLTDLKMGRNSTLSTESLRRIADYFGITIDELCGRNPARVITDNEIKFALLGENATDEMWREIKEFIEFKKRKK